MDSLFQQFSEPGQQKRQLLSVLHNSGTFTDVMQFIALEILDHLDLP
jgi:hypothetical protein